MEAVIVPTDRGDSWSEELTAALKVQRARTREFLAAQHARLRRAEEELTSELQRLAEEMAGKDRERRRIEEELDVRTEALGEQTATLERLKTELADRQSAWEKLQEQARAQWQEWQQQLTRCEEEFERRRIRWEQTAAAEQADWQRQLEQRRQRIEELETELSAARQEAAANRSGETESQRQLEQRRQRIEELETALSAARQEAAANRSGETESQRQLEHRRLRIEELETDLRAARQEAAVQSAEAEQARDRCRRLEEEKTQNRSQETQSTEEAARLRSERDELAEKLEEVQSQLSYATGQLAAAEPNAGADEESYHRRYQMALDDLKDLKAKNAELEEALAKRQAAPAPKAAVESGRIQDWELEKQRILAALEADFDADNEEQQAERLKIEEVLRKTEGLVADKDREIEELKHLLENQSGSLGTVAVGAAALGEVLDQDALVREAREELKTLQDQMREKMRQAEVEISVERAKLARQRQDLEERARFLEKYVPPEPSETPAPEKSTRGRWLERLGLKESDK